MIYKYSDLMKLSKKDLIDQHDSHAKNTCVGISYYLDEIKRRDTNKANNTVLLISIISLIVAIIAIFIK